MKSNLYKHYKVGGEAVNNTEKRVKYGFETTAFSCIYNVSIKSNLDTSVGRTSA